MPEISRFLGIVIGMFFNEHGVPHFHAVYGEHKITVEIESGSEHAADETQPRGFGRVNQVGQHVVDIPAGTPRRGMPCLRFQTPQVLKQGTPFAMHHGPDLGETNFAHGPTQPVAPDS